MSKLTLKLEEIKKRKKIGLMTHVVVGYPSLSETISLVKLMAKKGADIIELQIPFSDPLADGPTIMKACEEALIRGTKVKDAFSIMRMLSKEVSIPLVFMSYSNVVFKYGISKFCSDAEKAGATGLIVPDLPVEEENCEHLNFLCKKFNLSNIKVISPSSTDERLAINSKVSDGFVYCTARQGTTGAKDELPDLSIFLSRVRKFFNIPVAVGFGVSKKEHVELLKGQADIVITGSAIIDIINKRVETHKKIIQYLTGLGI